MITTDLANSCQSPCDVRLETSQLWLAQLSIIQKHSRQLRSPSWAHQSRSQCTGPAGAFHHCMPMYWSGMPAGSKCIQLPDQTLLQHQHGAFNDQHMFSTIPTTSTATSYTWQELTSCWVKSFQLARTYCFKLRKPKKPSKFLPQGMIFGSDCRTEQVRVLVSLGACRDLFYKQFEPVFQLSMLT